ncbi:AzlD domain-containing protein [Protaetiibacter mangrovi]|uniref:AzlD domain-containing protein n=1 Tax=Protaetiibacter mangrovi TaxID=2970926 RepID=A0ABT1ZIL5_9MICO|nr:AzlD domain-containing protein [Protaetiibacter mangrovi]MCS0500532.1 AzlD domain-containing protein [Protaetiibacter mangrovi]
MGDLLAIVLSGVVTYVTRVIFLISKRLRPPQRTLRYLPLVGPAVLGAIAVPGILAPREVFSLPETIPAVVAALVTFALFRWTKQIVVGLVGGLLVWWGLLWAVAALGWA